MNGLHLAQSTDGSRVDGVKAAKLKSLIQVISQVCVQIDSNEIHAPKAQTGTRHTV